MSEELSAVKVSYFFSTLEHRVHMNSENKMAAANEQSVSVVVPRQFALFSYSGYLISHS